MAEAHHQRERGASKPLAKRLRFDLSWSGAVKTQLNRDGDALPAELVFEPDLERVDAGDGGDRQRLDRSRRPAQRDLLADRLAARWAEQPVVDRRHAGRVAPAHGEEAFGMPALLAALDAWLEWLEGGIRWRRDPQGHRDDERCQSRFHGPNSPAGEPVGVLEVPSASDCGAGAGGGGASYSTVSTAGTASAVGTSSTVVGARRRLGARSAVFVFCPDRPDKRRTRFEGAAPFRWVAGGWTGLSIERPGSGLGSSGTGKWPVVRPAPPTTATQPAASLAPLAPGRREPRPLSSSHARSSNDRQSGRSGTSAAALRGTALKVRIVARQ